MTNPTTIDWIILLDRDGAAQQGVASDEPPRPAPGCARRRPWRLAAERQVVRRAGLVPRSVRGEPRPAAGGGGHGEEGARRDPVRAHAQATARILRDHTAPVSCIWTPGHGRCIGSSMRLPCPIPAVLTSVVLLAGACATSPPPPPAPPPISEPQPAVRCPKPASEESAAPLPPPPQLAATASPDTPIPFTPEMTAPTLLSGMAYPRYSREAVECGIEGRVVARCTLTVEGKLVDCALVKTLPFLGEAVLKVLATQQYSPAIYQGHPQAVFYTLTFKFKRS
jgi:hypothetical protein